MMIFKKAIPRRTFLRGLGATLALPLLDGMVPAFASPMNTAANSPIRMGVVYVPNGIMMDHWTPATVGTGYEMTPTLEPLAPFRDQFLVLSGLNNNEAVSRAGEASAFHTRTTAAYLTGVHPKATAGVDIQGGVSIDQIAAKELGKRTQVASLEVALDPVETSGVCEGEYTCAYINSLCWRTPQTPIPMEHQPREVFERLLGDNDTADSTARLARIRENRSLLDSLSREVSRLRQDLSSKDRSKLDEYLDATRDIERRIQIAEQQASRALPVVGLERPAGGIPASFDEYAKLMFDLQVLAYQTDLTRIITFRIAREYSGRTYPQIGVPEGHHTASHHRGDPELKAKVVLIDAYHMKLFSYYLEKLRSTPDGDGSLLDHTMILYGGGMSDGNMHMNQNVPTLLVGGGGGKIKGGRHIQYPRDTPLANLYLSMLDFMGVPLDKLGDSTGKLNLLSI